MDAAHIVNRTVGIPFPFGLHMTIRPHFSKYCFVIPFPFPFG